MEEIDPLSKIQYHTQKQREHGNEVLKEIEKINKARKEGRKPNESWQDWSFRAFSWKDHS